MCSIYFESNIHFLKLLSILLKSFDVYICMSNRNPFCADSEYSNEQCIMIWTTHASTHTKWVRFWVADFHFLRLLYITFGCVKFRASGNFSVFLVFVEQFLIRHEKRDITVNKLYVVLASWRPQDRILNFHNSNRATWI